MTSAAGVEIYLYGRSIPAVDSLQDELMRTVSDERGTPSAGLRLNPETVRTLQREQLVVRIQNRIVPGPGVAWIDQPLRQDLLSVLARTLEGYRTIISKDRLGQLEAAAGASGLGGDWDRILHVAIAGLLLDMGVRRQLLRQALVVRQPRTCWLWAFVGNTGSRHKYGVRLWYRPSHAYGIGQLWYGTGRPFPRLSTGEAEAIRSLFHPSTQHAYLENLMRLRYHRLVKYEQGLWLPAVPLLRCMPDDPLFSMLEGLAVELVRDTIKPVVPQLRVLSGRLPMVPFDSFLQASTRLLMEHALDMLIDQQIIPPLPEQPDPSFGFWFWQEDDARAFTGSLVNWNEGDAH